MATHRNLELEAELARTDDPDTYRVYADWLIQRGDPHGELIALDLARETEPHNQAIASARDVLLARNRETWLGELLALPHVDYSWRRGFIATLRIAGDDDHERAYRAVCALPIAALVRDVVLTGTASIDGLAALFALPPPQHLHTLHVTAAHDESVTYTDTLIDALVQRIRGTRLLRHLHGLDLSFSTLSERGAQAILAEPEHFAHLERLAIGETWVNLASIKRMRAAGLNVEARWHPHAGPPPPEPDDDD